MYSGVCVWTGPYAGFFHLGLYAEKVPNIRRIINNHLKIVNIVFFWGVGGSFPLTSAMYGPVRGDLYCVTFCGVKWVMGQVLV
jgi:hypothetical protein